MTRLSYMILGAFAAALARVLVTPTWPTVAATAITAGLLALDQARLVLGALNPRVDALEAAGKATAADLEAIKAKLTQVLNRGAR